MHLGAKKPLNRHLRKGFTLVELMISMFIMMVLSLAMVQISAGVFRSNTESIHMVQLSQQMRSAIQLISRDIRRAGYNDDSLAGFLSTQAIDSGVALGAVDANGVANCLQVQYDDLDGNEKNVVYRLRTVNSVGRVSANFDADADCDSSITDDDWVDISDPILTDISALDFVLDNQLTDIAENLSNGNTIQVGLEQVRISISATLRSNDNVSRTIVNEVQIRNQYLTV